jgi:eukaryotic-like serine/threonine-protein kinase
VVYQVGDVLWGYFQIQEHISTGGMAEVYRVIGGEDGTSQVAKVVRSDYIMDEAHRDRYVSFFRQEVDIHARMQHPQIVRCYENHVDHQPPGMVLQYVPGEDLRSIINGLNGQAMENSAVLQVIQQISAALMYLHQQGFCHCDLKPGNILRAEDGNYYLTDFGVAQPMGHSGIPKGTWYCMAPEQFEQGMITPHTDVYSLGMTVYELVTGGFRPFADRTRDSENTGASSSDSGRDKQHYVDPPPPSHFNPAIRDEVNQVIMKALAKRPEDRQATPDILVQQLRRAFKPPGVGARFRKHSAGGNPPRPARLICTRGVHQGRSFPIDKASILVGRSEHDCDLVIAEENVSRRHLLISWEGQAQDGGSYFLQDQVSTYGTRVNGRAELACRLHSDDLISIAGNNFRFEII